MKNVLALAVIAVFIAGSSLAASPHKHHAMSRAKQNCKCYTNQPNCSGQAIFASAPRSCAVSGYPQSCVVNSVHGQSQIYLYEAGETFSVSVGYGDMYACVPGVNGVPIGTPGHPIGVAK